jgi:hypothetical protein
MDRIRLTPEAELKDFKIFRDRHGGICSFLLVMRRQPLNVLDEDASPLKAKIGQKYFSSAYLRTTLVKESTLVQQSLQLKLCIYPATSISLS